MSTQTKNTTPAAPKPISAPEIQASKGQRKLACMTAYDYPSALMADRAGMDLILVGDSLAMVALGMEDTLSVTMDQMIHHTLAASRGVSNALLVGDMPFMSYQPGVELAVRNAGRFLSEGKAKAVKLEGGSPVVPQIKAISEAGIPVMAHIGLTPQHIARFGGFKVQGKTLESIKILIEEARAVEQAGAFAVVLEAMPVEAAEMITEAVAIPTIGIGAGNVTDGQVLVCNDVLGVFDRFTPKFVRQYAKLGEQAEAALRAYAEDVRYGRFPGEKNTFRMTEDQLAQIKKLKIKAKKK